MFRSPLRSLFLPVLRTYATRSSQANQIRRILRKEAPELPPSEKLQLCVSASKCQQYDLALARKAMLDDELQPRIMDGGEALWTRFPGNRDLFVLRNGSVVGWNFTEHHVSEFIVPRLAGAEIESFAKVETEDMDYIEEQSNDTRSGMVGGVIYVHGPTEGSRLSDKLAFSSGMARHTKLSAIEVDSERLIEQVKFISSNMAKGKTPKLNLKQLDQFTGRLLQLRGTLNLYSTITEIPDIYWSKPEQETLYEIISKSLDVEPRIEILNRKLDYAAEMVSILRQHQSERISMRLEWLIVILILVEVVIELRKFIPGMEEEETEKSEK